MKRFFSIFEVIAAVTGIAVCLWLVFAVVPQEQVMGIVQKIFYFHVPSAYSMYLGWSLCAGASILYIIRGSERFDMFARSAAEIALLFAVMVMITGPLWGRKSWGAYWVWDPRLTSALLLTLIILSYVILRQVGKGEAVRKFAAALAVVGAAIIPLVHVSVDKWRGQHPTVLKKGGLAPEMLMVFGACMAAFTVVFAVLLHWRYVLEKRRAQLLHLENLAATESSMTGGGE